MTTPPRIPETRRRGPNGRFLPRPESAETQLIEAPDPAEAAVEPDPEPVRTEPVLTEREVTELATSEMVADLSVDDDSDEDEDEPGYELPEDRFLNRELSWLDFNARVLALAEDPGTPLLERAKFLAIFASNLDEFYMVRVAGLKRRLSAGLPMRGGDRSPLRHQIEMITERTTDLVTRHAAC